MVEPTPIDVIAYHEAGHAVVALYYARNVIGISVGQPTSEESHVYHDPPRPIGNCRIDPDNLTAVWPLAVEDAFIDSRILWEDPLPKRYMRVNRFVKSNSDRMARISLTS